MTYQVREIALTMFPKKKKTLFPEIDNNHSVLSQYQVEMRSFMCKVRREAKSSQKVWLWGPGVFFLRSDFLDPSSFWSLISFLLPTSGQEQDRPLSDSTHASLLQGQPESQNPHSRKIIQVYRPITHRKKVGKQMTERYNCGHAPSTGRRQEHTITANASNTKVCDDC